MTGPNLLAAAGGWLIGFSFVLLSGGGVAPAALGATFGAAAFLTIAALGGVGR